MADATDARRIFYHVVDLLNQHYLLTNRTSRKYQPKRLLVEKNLDNLVNKLDWRPAPESPPDRRKRCLIFTPQVCREILEEDDDSSTPVSELRTRIVEAIEYHRANALGVDDTMTSDLRIPSSDDEESEDGDPSRSRSRSRSRSHSPSTRRSPRDRSRSRSRSPPRGQQQQQRAQPRGQQQQQQQRSPPRGQQQQQQQQRSPPRGQQQQQQRSPPRGRPLLLPPGSAEEIAALKNTAMQALLPQDFRTFDAAYVVISQGVEGKSDAEKREIWGKICPLNTARSTRPFRDMVQVACDVFVGKRRANNNDLMDLVIDVAVAAVPDEHIDADRLRFALPIVYRCTMLPFPTPSVVLECEAAEVDEHLRAAYNLLFSWELRALQPDGTRRVPEPWVAKICATALRLLDCIL
jgi:hypothetical protein